MTDQPETYGAKLTERMTAPVFDPETNEVVGWEQVPRSVIWPSAEAYERWVEDGRPYITDFLEEDDTGRRIREAIGRGREVE